LRWGDEVILEAWDQCYRYEVRSVETVAGDAISALKHESLDWVTLLTCADFDESLHHYRGRVALCTVLIQIDPLSPPCPRPYARAACWATVCPEGTRVVEGGYNPRACP